MRYEVLKPIPGFPHRPGATVEGDFRNVDTLVSQRFLKPIGDRDRIEALEARVAELEAALGKGKLKH